MNRDVVIIGAGPGGLAASLLLANAGCNVTILERQPRVGGRCTALEIDGFRFDLGPTFFLHPRTLEEIFAACGARLARHFTDARIRLAFSFQSKYLGMSPFDCPNLFTILSFIEYAFGIFHPIGGCGAVSEAMAELARSIDVRIRLNEPVKHLVFSGRRAVGVETSAARYCADGDPPGLRKPTYPAQPS